MTAELVSYQRANKVGVVTLTRPEKLNAINRSLQKALEAAFQEAERDDATSVVVLRAAGRSFCVGYDIDREAQDQPDSDDADAREAEYQEYVRFQMMPWRLKKPVIASVQGYALGAGCEIAMVCDITIAADDAMFGEPEVRFSTVGPVIAMPWYVGLKRARELIYMGDTLNAEAALSVGMVNKVVPRHDLDKASMDYAERLALISPEALQAAKLAMNQALEATGFEAGIFSAAKHLSKLNASNTVVGREFVELIRSKGLKEALRWRHGQFKTAVFGAEVQRDGGKKEDL